MEKAHRMTGERRVALKIPCQLLTGPVRKPTASSMSAADRSGVAGGASDELVQPIGMSRSSKLGGAAQENWEP